MPDTVTRTIERGSPDQKGFTLIELLIVVGIIVALAAVIIPLVIQFAGKGEEGSRASEWEAIQTGIDSLMADAAAISIASVGVPTTLTGGEGFGLGGKTIGQFVRDLPTTCEYTWDVLGTMTQDQSAGGPCEP